MKRFSLGLLALITGLMAAGAAAARPPVWVVRDADSEIVLFGSVHILPPGLDWRPPELERAIRNADDVWFELPIDAATEAETLKLAAQMGVLAPDQSLFKMLPKADGERLLKVAEAYGADPATLDRLKPWLAEVALSGAAYRRAGADGQDGVEKEIAAEAPARVQRRAFETPRQQIEILAGEPQAEQVASLRETLKEMEDDPDEFKTLVRAWMDGDLKTIDREAIKPLRKASPTLFQHLVTDRNARWTTLLDQRLKGHGRSVVVVGMAHLVGPNGVPARLRALGYQVEGP
jgi:uncharacterized protein YbaP (TraB family)